MSQTFPITPEQHQERLQIRFCSNCEAHFAGRCRRGAPGPQGWPNVEPTDRCLQWTWATQPRVGWGSAICEAERREFQARQQIEEAPPF